MAVVHTTVLELLGKQVSFTRSFEIDSFAYFQVLLLLL